MRRAVALAAASLILAGCSASAASSGSTSTSSQSATQTKATTFSLSQSCSYLTSDIEGVVDFGHDDDSDSTSADNLAKRLRTNIAQAPDPIHDDIELLIANLEEIQTGATMKVADFTEPAERVLTACGVDYTSANDPLADSTDEPSADRTEDSEEVDPLASLSEAARKYVKERVYSEPGDDNYASDVKSEVKTGRKVCGKIGDHKPGWSRSRYIYDRYTNEYDAYDAITYLCPKSKDDLKIAKRTISDGSDGDVGGSIKPGTYASDDRVRNCYWERQTGGGNIIANDFVTHAADGITVTIRNSDGGFSTNGCGNLYPTAKP